MRACEGREIKLRGWRGGPEMESGDRGGQGWILENVAEDRELSLEPADRPGMEPGGQWDGV